MSFQGWGGWLLLVLFLHSACTPRVVREAPARERRYSFRAEPVSSPMGSDGVRVSASELDAALTELVLGIPLRVVAPTPRLSVRRVLARTSSSLTGASWRTPLARSYGLHCERSGTPGDCLALRQGLRELAEEISTQGSRLYNLLTRRARP